MSINKDSAGYRLKMIGVNYFGTSLNFAKHLGIDQSLMSQYVHGKRPVGAALRDQLEQVGVNPDYIESGALPKFLDNENGRKILQNKANQLLKPVKKNKQNLATSNKEEFTTNVTLTPYFETREMFEDDGEVSMMPELGISVRAGNPTIFIAEDVRGFRNMRGLFIAKITGDSMTGEGLHDGDEIIIERRSEFKTGDIIVARIGDSYTLKKVVNGNGYILLNPANPDYEPIVISPENHDEFECIGVWTEFIRTRR